MHRYGLDRTDATDARPGKVEGIGDTRTGRRGGDGDSTLRPIMLIERASGLTCFILSVSRGHLNDGHNLSSELSVCIRMRSEQRWLDRGIQIDEASICMYLVGEGHRQFACLCLLGHVFCKRSADAANPHYHCRLASGA